MNHSIITLICLTTVALISVGVLADGNTSSTVDSNRASPAETKRNLWRSNIQAPNNSDQQGSLELKRTVHQVKTIRFRESKVESVDTVSESYKSPTTKPSVQATKQPAEMNPATLIKLRSVPVNKLVDLSELGDGLFLKGHTNVAEGLYQRAHQHSKDDKDKAWTLYQSANCHWESAPAEAGKIYEKLIAEYPDSLWSKLAKVQNDFLKLQVPKDVSLLMKNIKSQQKE